ncbi:MAG: hypothetical protein PW734_11920 [Verrucomicrobium sp.]|nr:hypothetical protein [Verrucomicrobium sp.]
MSARVLIAVGEEKTRQAVSALLKAFPAELSWADDGAAFFTYLKSPQGMDLIIYDDGWPDLSVELIAHSARKAAEKSDPYLLALVEGENPVTSFLALGAGADMVLKKPVEPVSFLAACMTGRRLALLGRQVKAIQAQAAAAAEAAGQEKKSEAAHPPAKREEMPAPRPFVLAEDGRLLVVKVIEDALEKAFTDLEVDRHDLRKGELKELFKGDFLGWQGAFFPQEGRWYDILFRLTRPAAEHLAKLVLPHDPRDDEHLMRGVTILLEAVEAACRDRLMRGAEKSTPVFSPPIVRPIFDVSEAGDPLSSHIFRFPGFSLAYDVHAAPSVARIQPSESALPGDILNENIMADPKDRIPVASRGILLTESRLKVIRPHLKPESTLWLIQPSLFARQMGSRFLT